MKELLELRVPEDRVGRLFRPDEGVRLGSGGVRKLLISMTDPRLKTVGELQRKQPQGKPFFFGWDIHRKYDKREMDAAELFSLHVNAVFEPSGEMCGTEYDESSACSKCGVGRQQKSRLILNLRKAPKTKPIARTIAKEVIMRHDLVQAIRAAGLTGCIFEQVRHKSGLLDVPDDYFDVPTGRLLIEMAERQGLDFSKRWSSEFTRWLSMLERQSMVRRADQEHAELMAKRERRLGKVPPDWFQPLFTSPALRFHEKTVFGNGPFDLDEDKEHVCPFGHTKGLNLLSEVFVRREDYEGADIICTKECVGTKRGVLMPSPLMLISQRFYQLLQKHEFKGYTVEVAHLI